MSTCIDCCYLIDAKKIREIVGLQTDNTLTDDAIKTALDQSHELALDSWIGDDCRAVICETLEAEEANSSPTPTEIIEYEKNNCLYDYVQKYLAFMTLTYYIQLNPNIKIFGRGVGRGAISQSAPFTPAEDYQKDGLANNYSAFAESWRKKAEAWLATDYSNVLFPTYTKNSDFFPCLPEDDECATKEYNLTGGFFIGSTGDAE